MGFRSEYADFNRQYPAQTIQTTNSPIRCRIGGDGAVIVLLPGVTGRMDVTYRLFSQLAQHFKVLSYDIPVWANTPESMVNLLPMVMDATNVDSAWLVGESIGGVMALLSGEQYADHIRGVIIDDTAQWPWISSQAPVLDQLTTALQKGLPQLEKTPRRLVVSKAKAKLRRYLIDQPQPQAAYLTNMADALTKDITVAEIVQTGQLMLDCIKMARQQPVPVVLQSKPVLVFGGETTALNNDYVSLLLNASEYAQEIFKFIMEVETQ